MGGLLPLTFANPQDYDKIEAEDRLSLENIENLSPGSPVECTVHRRNSPNFSIILNHTLNENQIDGSKLDLLSTKLNRILAKLSRILGKIRNNFCNLINYFSLYYYNLIFNEINEFYI